MKPLLRSVLVASGCALLGLLVGGSYGISGGGTAVNAGLVAALVFGLIGLYIDVRLQQAKALRASARACGLRVDGAALHLDLIDGRSLSVPLAWFPPLASAEPGALARAQLKRSGRVVRWDALGVKLSVHALLRGQPGPAENSVAMPVRPRNEASAA